MFQTIINNLLCHCMYITFESAKSFTFESWFSFMEI